VAFTAGKSSDTGLPLRIGQIRETAVGADVGSGSPQAVARFLKEEQAKGSKVIKEANITPP
jgi:hypothetical protein